VSEERLKAVESDVIELKTSVSQVCSAVRELTGEIREMVKQTARDNERWHQQTEINRKTVDRLDSHDAQMKDIQINQAVSKSRLDPILGLFWKVTSGVAAAAILGGLAYKLIGG